MKISRSSRTRTTPLELRATAAIDPECVVGLVHYDTGALYAVSPATKRVVVGAFDADPAAPAGHHIAIQSDHVSTHHCTLIRRGRTLQVVDQGSKNGTFFAGRRLKTGKGVDLHPGDLFTIAAITQRLLVLNAAMWAAYPRLVDILGEPHQHALPSASATPSDFIVTAASRRHVLITSEPNCEQGVLAGLIHTLVPFSPRPEIVCERAPVSPNEQDDMLRAAARSTLVLSLGDDDTRLPSRFVEALFSSKFRIRVVVLASGMTVADRALGRGYVGQLQHIWVPPLAMRREAICGLLDRVLAERGSPLRVDAMTAQNQDALRRNDWKDNFAELRDTAAKLAAVQAHGSKLAASKALGMSQSTFYLWWSSMGFSKDLLRDEADRPEERAGFRRHDPRDIAT